VTVRQYGRRLLDMSPRWMRELEAAKVLVAIGAHVDRMIDGAVAAVQHGHPGIVSNESLGYIGSDRLLRQPPLESAAAFTERLRGWRDVHRRRGTGRALLEQLRVVFADAIPETRLQYRNGVEYVLHTDGTITRGASTLRALSGPPERWARWWLDISGGVLANASVPLLVLLTTEWNAEHTQGRVFVRNNARRWSGSRRWSDPRPWASEPAVTWEV
jgi:hypothetical protein